MRICKRKEKVEEEREYHCRLYMKGPYCCHHSTLVFLSQSRTWVNPDQMTAVSLKFPKDTSPVRIFCCSVTKKKVYVASEFFPQHFRY